MSLKTFRCTPIKNEQGLINVDKTEIFNLQDEKERYPTAGRQWRIGDIIDEADIWLNENNVAFNRKLYNL